MYTVGKTSCDGSVQQGVGPGGGCVTCVPSRTERKAKDNLCSDTQFQRAFIV